VTASSEPVWQPRELRRRQSRAADGGFHQRSVAGLRRL